MSVTVHIPAVYPREDFDAQRELLDRAHVEVEESIRGWTLTFPDGWQVDSRRRKSDRVWAQPRVEAANGPAVPSYFTFDKGWVQR